jgi:hypothetical protein
LLSDRVFPDASLQALDKKPLWLSHAMETNEFHCPSLQLHLQLATQQ